ncbi:hypothetical protein [Nocardioides solisilvae]|uniref:hypothetical protein n=1 Tax=Nocardioides solisilvae TaxID=1542435 RepID=UPI000D74D08A|nr:hypothetical protein [Nocardioides solisilvae]
MSGGRTDAGEAVDALAEALREDPVQVHELYGNGRTGEVREALGDLVDDLDFPAYVVLVPEPPGLSGDAPEEELATLLHDRLGGDAIFHVQLDPLAVAGRTVGFGDVPSAHAPAQFTYDRWEPGEYPEYLTSAGEAARNLTLVAREGDMTTAEYEAWAEVGLWRQPPEWDLDHEPVMPGAYAHHATLAFVLVAGFVWLSLRAVAQWRALPAVPRAGTPAGTSAGAADLRGSGEGDPAAPAEVRAEVEGALDALAQRLARGAAGDATTRTLVDGSYDTARLLLARHGDADHDLDDLVGALVLVRMADRALDAAEAPRRRRPRPYLPCFFDPRHGEGRHRRSVPVADRRLEVPVCDACRAAPEAGLRPLRVARRRLGGPRPWYEHDTVWTRTGYGAFVAELWRPVADELAGGGR